jgi:hypothetical protein
MQDVKISQLLDGSVAISEIDIVPIVQSGTSKRVTIGDILDLGKTVAGPVTSAIDDLVAFDSIDGRVSKDSGITITGAASAVTLKHAQNTDTELGALAANINMNTHKLTSLSVPTTNGDSIRTTTKITEALLESATDLKHAQNTDTGTNALSFRVGAGADDNIYYYAQNADANKPYIRYNKTANAWYFSNDGVAELAITGPGGVSFSTAAEITAGVVSTKAIAPDQLALANIVFPTGTAMWFYQNVAPTGWTLSATTSDVLLAVKGGTGAYNVNGGTQAGTWTAPAHTLDTTEIPAHTHDVGANVGVPVFSISFNPAGSGTNIYDATAWLSSMADNVNAVTELKLFQTNTVGGGLSHNHGGTTYRPLANVGIICTKN